MKPAIAITISLTLGACSGSWRNFTIEEAGRPKERLSAAREYEYRNPYRKPVEVKGNIYDLPPCDDPEIMPKPSNC